MNRFLLIACLLVGWAAGCSDSVDQSEPVGGGETPAGVEPLLELVAANRPETVEYPYTVVATTGMVADLVRQVAGDRAEVSGLLNSDVDPHLYAPRPSDVRDIQSADIVFYTGLYLEGRMTEVFDGALQRGVPVFPVGEALPEDQLLMPDGSGGHPDPHVWMDVTLWSACADAVAEALATFDPASAAYYRENAAAYNAQLAELDAYVQEVVDSIPEGQRTLVTAHDAFAYFSRAYDIPVASVAGISTESEPGGRDVLELVDLIESSGVPAVFIESTIPRATMQSVIDEAASRGVSVEIGGELFSDAMGEAGTYEGTYLGMIDHNATTIGRALGGDAPALGWRGLLSEGVSP